MRFNSIASRGSTVAPQAMQSHVLLDYYRCPEEFAQIESVGELLRDEGFFQFGQGNLCYGRCQVGSVASRVSGLLFDARDTVEIDEGRVRLPFDLTEIIDNLRTERYATVSPNSKATLILETLKRNIYYFLRSWMPSGVRRLLQRAYFKGWDGLRFPQWPVDHTVESIVQESLMLSMKAKGVSSVPFIWFWPEGAQSCAMMTHDVETRAGLADCLELMALDDSFEIKSSFQFVPEERYVIPGELLEELRSNGFEINIQDLNHDGRLFRDREIFLRRASRINDYLRQIRAKGFRSAIMYRNAEWLNTIQASYDMSFPSVAHLEPQRGGCCTVMPYFIGRLLELPLTTAQDYSLLHILGESSINIWMQQIDLIREENGLISFIVHPDYLRDKPGMALYRSLLYHLCYLRDEHNVWIALPGEIDEWWRARSQMELHFQNGKWHIEGEGNERARIAYATPANGGLAYSFHQG